jgi:flagellar hook-associated protein 3 FlgL
MRIPSSMMKRQLLSNLDSVYNTMAKQQTQVSTGKAFQKASEDPINAVRSMDINSDINKSEQYEENIYEAESMLNAQEEAMGTITDSLSQVKEVIQQALNSTYNDGNKESFAQVVDAAKENIIDFLNKDYGGKYIFGGWNTSSTPVENDSGTYAFNGTSIEGMTADESNGFMAQEFKYRTGNGTNVDVAMSALEITGSGEDNLISLLENISNELNNPSGSNDKLNEYLDKTTEFFDDTLAKRSAIGTKMSGLDVLRNQNTEDRTSLMNLLSQVEDIDIEEALINFKTSEMAYEAAMSVGSSIIQKSLVDFIN